MFRPLCTPKGYHNHTRYAWPACSDLFTHLQTQHRTPRSHKVCLASMFRPLCTPKGYHDHTKYAWSACSGLFAHLQDTTITQSMPASMFRPLHTYRTPQSHQVCLASMFRPLRTPTYTAQDTTITQSIPDQHVQTSSHTPTSTTQDTTITQSMPGQHVWTSAHRQAQHTTSQSHKVRLVSMFRHLRTPSGTTGHHNHKKYALSACSDLCTLSGTAQDTTITQSMPCQHVLTSLHAFRHITITQSMAL